LALYDPQQHRSHASLYGGHDPGVCCRLHSGLTLWALGYPDQALKSVQEALSLARELSHPLTTAQALYFAGSVYYHRGESRAAEENAQALVTVGTAQGFSYWAEVGSILLARLLVEEGRSEEGIAQLQAKLAAIRAARWGWREAFSLGLVLEGYAGARQPAKGLQLLSDVLADKNIEGFYEPELHRIRGELLLKEPAGLSREAELCFRRAVQITRGRQQKSLELRAVTSLSRLLNRQGKREEARQMLAEIYGWFSEGFDTADLKEAKALLDELA